MALSHLNAFVACQSCLRQLSSACGHFFMIVMASFVLGLTFMTWWAVVPAVYLPWMLHGGILEKIGGSFICIGMSFLALMVAWCYLTCVFTDPGRVPPGWHPFASDEQAEVELQRLAFADHYFDRRDPRRPRFCKRCQQWKPERAHHCSTTGRCILKMDHHCIWVSNCVGLLNYKHFLLFLVWTGVGSLSAFLLLLPSLIDFIRGKLFGPNTPVVFISTIINFAFSLAVLGFLLMHLQLIANNCTTSELL